MTAETQAYEPEKLTAGVTWKWKKTISDYPASEWALTYYLRKSGATDEAGNTLMEVEPGAIGELPMGTTFQSWNPDHPVGSYAGFVKSCLRGIAAGLGVSYNMLVNELEGVNYSSIRAGLLDGRGYDKAVQRWFTDT